MPTMSISKSFEQKGSISLSGFLNNFLGFTQNYAIRYTATVTLKDGGLIKTSTKSTAEGMFIDVTIEGIVYRVSVEAVEPVTTYQEVSGIGYFKSPKNPDNGTLSMATILNGLKSSVNSNLANVLQIEISTRALLSLYSAYSSFSLFFSLLNSDDNE